VAETEREEVRQELTIERVVPGGAGLARVGGLVALVSGAFPGDLVLAKLSRGGSRLLIGRAAEILSPGPHRRAEEDVCPRAADGRCGGCDWAAVRPGSAPGLKTSLLLDALRRVGRIPADEIPPVAYVPSPFGYRLRNRLHLDRSGRLGFFAPRSNRVEADLDVCEVVSDALRARLDPARELLRAVGPAEGEISTLEDREGKAVLAELRLGPVYRPPAFRAGRGPFDGLRVVDSDGRLLFEDGASALDLEAGGTTFRVSVSSFFQGNRFLLDPFLEEIRASLRAGIPAGEGETRAFRALDLYAGVGFLTFPLLETARQRGGDVIAVEMDPSSSSDLSTNLRRWDGGGPSRSRSVRSSAEAFLSSKGAATGPGFEVVVADPPRAGLSPAARDGLVRLAPRSLVLVSCDPPTFARDLGALRPFYRLERLTLLDLFPGTHHVEAVALLVRRT